MRRVLAWLRESWPTIALGSLLWVMLWGDLTWANILAGAALGAIVALSFPLPPLERIATVRFVPLLHVAGRFIGDLVFASFQVAWAAVRPGKPPRGAFVDVPLHPAPDLLLSTTASLSSLVPGTFVVDLDESGPTLTLHVLDIAESGGPENVRRFTLELEERVLRAFASRDELVRAGLIEEPAPSPTSTQERP